MDVSFKEKLVTIFHELWHINPDFNGDLRRHAGRCYVHTHSQKAYDAEMGHMAERWVQLGPPCELYGFLRCRFDDLAREQGGIYGVKIPHPKLIPVE
jgi:hypothetical protein